MVNGVWRGNTSLKELGTGLVDAMREHGLDPMDASRDKRPSGTYIRDYGTARQWKRRPRAAPTRTAASPTCTRTAENSSVCQPSPARRNEHAKRIIDYCWVDVRGTYKLALRMLGRPRPRPSAVARAVSRAHRVVRTQRNPSQRRALPPDRAAPRRPADRDRREGRAEERLRRLCHRGHEEESAPAGGLQDEEI